MLVPTALGAPRDEDDMGPRITVSGLPEKCFVGKREFQVRVRDEGSKIGLVSVFVDGRKLTSKEGAPPKVIVDDRKLAPGKHRLAVYARDTAGNRTRRAYPFEVCGD